MHVDLDQVRERLSSQGQSVTPAHVAAAMEWLGYVVSDSSILQTVAALRRESQGAGVLESLLRQPGVTDAIVNGAKQVYIDRGRGLELADLTFPSDDDVRRLAVRLAAQVGRRLDDGLPYVDARLTDGTRVHAVLGCISDPGTCISLRVPARVRLTLDDWQRNRSMTDEGRGIIEALVARKRAFLVAGGTGSGKTTLLSSMLATVPATERLLIVEDSRELSPGHPHVVRLEARLANSEGAGAVTLTDLVRQALRMRPDRLIVGEVRGAELVDLLGALNTGHEGGCGTVHANSASAIPARLEALGALGGLARAAVHSQVAAALDAVLQLKRTASGQRYLAEVGAFEQDTQGLVHVQPAVTFDPEGRARRGPAWERLGEVLA